MFISILRAIKYFVLTCLLTADCNAPDNRCHIKLFKNRLDKYRTNQDVVYDYKSDLKGTGGLLVCAYVMLFEMRAERNSCARNITLDWIGFGLDINYTVPFAYM